MELNNIQVIQTGFEEILNQVKEDFIHNNSNIFSQLIIKLENYLNTLDQLVTGYKQEITRVAAYEPTLGTTQAAGLAWKNFAKTKNNINRENEYLLLIKQGELLIEQIREKFTEEKTVINIGVSYRGKVYEVSLNLNEALNMAKIGISSNGDIVLKSGAKGYNKGELIKSATEINNSDILKKLIQQSTNKGNAYEAFRNRVKGLNKRLSNVKLLEKIRKNTVSGVYGGDIYYKEGQQIISEQIKFYGSSQFSFLSLNTIQSTLKIYLECFKAFQAGDINPQVVQKLKAAMIRQQSTTKIEKEASKIAEETLDKILGVKRK